MRGRHRRGVGGARRALGLGMRLAARTRRRDMLRNLALSGATGLACFIVILAVAASVVAGKQTDRSADRSPRGGEHSDLRVMPVTDGIDSSSATRVMASVTGLNPPVPPGLSAWPVPGTMAASPALAARIASDPQIAARYPWPVTQIIGDAGLLDPAEYYSYVHIPADQVPAESSAGWISVDYYGPYRGPEVGDFMPDSEQVIPYLAAVLMLLPLAALIVVCARLNSHVRDKRIASLRLLGMSRRAVATVTAVEIGAVALVGTVAGLLVFNLVRPLRSGWTFGEFSFFSSDAALSPLTQVLFVVAIVGFAVAVAVAGTLGAASDPLAQRRHVRHRSFSTAIGVVSVVVAVAALVFAMGQHNLQGLILSVGATLLAAVGIALVLPGVTSIMMGVIGAKASANLLAWRRQSSSGAISRLTGALVFLFVLAGSATGSVGAIVKTATAIDGTGDELVVMVSEVGNYPERIEWLFAKPDEVHVQPVGISGYLGGDVSNSRAFMTSCRYLLGGKLVSECVDGQTYRTPGSPTTGGHYEFDRIDVTIADPVADLALTDKDNVHLARSLIVTSLDTQPRELQGGLGVSATFLDSPDVRQYIQENLAKQFPYAYVRGNFGGSSGFDSQAATTLGIVLAALAGGLVTATLGVILVDRAHQRRRQNNPLLAMGIPGRVLRRAEILTIAAPSLTGLLLAVPVTVLGIIALTSSGRRQLEWDRVAASLHYLPWIGLSYVILTGLLAIITAAGVRTRIDPTLLRQE